MNTHIHRLLDEAFDGVTMSPEVRELKEEVRANVMARTEELEAAGASPADAARQAIDELGSVEDLLGAPVAPGMPDARAGKAPNAADLHARNKVRPNPGFVVRVTLLSVAATAAVVLAVLAAFEVVGGEARTVLALGLAGAALLGFITADSLRQETTSNYAMPLGRAALWGLATFAGVAALAAFGAFAVDTSAVALAIAGGVLALVSIGLFSWLGATQTNRHKAWVRELGADYSAHQGGAQWSDPNAAARFGMYSGAIWVAGIGAGVALAIIFAWWWSLVVLGVCIVLTMIVQASTMFRSTKD
ncbi:permease prefix domain 1-containing protein [Demequina sp.]|uniref:permease prefix domain 1-containing protein n=1 Tax=Demequina sp. TaxID=2050685 RepID=UPI003D0FAE61